MDWLNKLDNVLDNAFLFGTQQQEAEEEEVDQSNSVTGVDEMDYYYCDDEQQLEQDLFHNHTDTDDEGGDDLELNLGDDSIVKSEEITSLPLNNGSDSGSNLRMNTVTEDATNTHNCDNPNHDKGNAVKAKEDEEANHDDDCDNKNFTNSNTGTSTGTKSQQQLQQQQLPKPIAVPVPIRVNPMGGRDNFRPSGIGMLRGRTPGGSTTATSASAVHVRRPGMILSVLRDDLSDDESTSSGSGEHNIGDNNSNSNSDGNDDHSNHDSTNSSHRQQSRSSSKQDRNNVDNYDTDNDDMLLRKRPSIVIQNHDLNQYQDDQISPIASSSLSPSSPTKRKSNRILLASNIIARSTTSNRIDDEEIANSSPGQQQLPLQGQTPSQTQGLPPLPILISKQGSQSNTTIELLNVQYNHNSNIPNPPTPGTGTDTDTASANIISRRSSSNHSIKTDLIKNTSTISSDDFGIYDNDDDDNDYEADHNVDINDIYTRGDIIHEHQIISTITATTTNADHNDDDDDYRKKANRQEKKKSTTKTMKVLQATIGDYLFSQGGTDLSNNMDDDDYDSDDDDDDYDYDDNYHGDSFESEGDEEEKEDYVIDTQFYTWNADNSSANENSEDITSSSPSPPSFDPSVNCHGIVHVKLLRVQHLPINAGTTVEAIISLPPWKGRIRSEKVSSYDGPKTAGVCARWDQKLKNKKDLLSKNYGEPDTIVSTEDLATSKKDFHSDDSSIEKDQNEVQRHAMVHAYNNEETPIPNISIELKGTTLQMFKKDICTFTLSVEPLMRQPGEFRRRWCLADHGNSQDMKQTNVRSQKKHDDDCNEEMENEDIDLDISPIILIEACFEPTEFGGEKISSKKIMPTILTTQSSSQDNNVDNEEMPSQPRERLDTLDSYESHSPKRLTNKPHLFRLHSDWRPAYCAVCSTMLFRNGYRCEACKLDCCADCQLQVDVELPCGSNAAHAAVERVSKSRLTVANLYSILAPVKESSDEKDDESKSRLITIPDIPQSDINSERAVWNEGVGTFKLRIIKACVFQRSFPPETEISYILKNSDRWLRRGDHYVRVSWTNSKETKRTKAVFQTAKPRFDSEEMHITAMHYGTEFRIEILDASTDASIGSTLVTTQGLLQWQRDELVVEGGLSLSDIIKQGPIAVKTRKAILELRAGVKSGFGLDFYNSRAGEISGWIEVEMGFEEDVDIYSNSKPKPCPSRPSNDFNMDLIQLHIARIFSLLEDLNELFGAYFYLVSWKNPALTSLSLIIFVTLCLRFNAEYFGSLPLAFSIFYMLHLYLKRTKGYRAYLQRKERDASLKEMKGATVHYRGHRPTGTLKISVMKGQHLTPQLGLGIPGSLVATLSWDPTKYLDDKSRKRLVDIDPTSKSLYHLGETESSSVTFNPEWKVIHSSNQLQRLKQLLPSTNFLSRTSSDEIGSREEKALITRSASILEVPILQPILGSKQIADIKSENEEEEEESADTIELMPWEASDGAIIVQVRFTDVLSKLQIFDQILGEVVIPFKRIINSRVDGWFQVLPKGTRDTIEDNDADEPEHTDKKPFLTHLTDADSDSKTEAITQSEVNQPRIYVKATFDLPHDNVTDIDRETSIVVAEHMIWSSNAAKDNRGFIGSSLETFNSVRGITGQVQYLQNQLGTILDAIEILRNTFNFTSPEKSLFILCCLAILWFLFALLPSRFIFLCAGLGQYSATFMVFMKSNNIIKGGVEKKELDTPKYETLSDQNKELYDPISTRIFNFFKSIPTNEDLRRYYFWEARKVGANEKKVWAAKRRNGRLTKLYQAQWFGKLELKTPNTLAPTEDDRHWDWISIFAIIQGHRFVWWQSENDFDDGENPAGQLFFAGHSGLAGLSPLEIREFKKNEIEKVVNIFGRGIGAKGQFKISLLVEDNTMKEKLEAAVLNATLHGKNE